MSEKEVSPYATDEMYLPFHYKEIHMKEEPHFKGKGNMSIRGLEALCEDFVEYTHQQAIIKHNCMKIIIELRLNQKI